MLAPLALVALLAGGVSSAVVLSDDDQAQTRDDVRVAAIDVQSHRTDSPLIN
jgi:hypothetical protein